MWHRRFPWLDTTKLFLGEGEAISFDRVSKVELRSKMEEVRLFHLHDEGFAAVGPSGGPSKGLFGVKGTHPAPVSDLKTPESGRPRNNSCLLMVTGCILVLIFEEVEKCLKPLRICIGAETFL